MSGFLGAGSRVARSIVAQQGGLVEKAHFGAKGGPTMSDEWHKGHHDSQSSELIDPLVEIISGAGRNAPPGRN
jgi:hypothetical protein